jgi:hypothetical protein
MATAEQTELKASHRPLTFPEVVLKAGMALLMIANQLGIGPGGADTIQKVEAVPARTPMVETKTGVEEDETKRRRRDGNGHS